MELRPGPPGRKWRRLTLFWGLVLLWNNSVSAQNPQAVPLVQTASPSASSALGDASEGADATGPRKIGALDAEGEIRRGEGGCAVLGGRGRGVRRACQTGSLG